jgi:hypothetical protein
MEPLSMPQIVAKSMYNIPILNLRQEYMLSTNTSRCRTQELCGGFFFGEGYCAAMSVATCTPSNVSGTFYAPQSGGYTSYIAGSGSCGRIQWDGRN